MPFDQSYLWFLLKEEKAYIEKGYPKCQNEIHKEKLKFIVNYQQFISKKKMLRPRNTVELKPQVKPF